MDHQYVSNLLLAVPLLPLITALVLILAPLFSINLSKIVTSILAVGSIAAAALCSLLLNSQLSNGLENSFNAIYGNWVHVDKFSISFGFYLDSLSLVMISIITGVGFLIHLYSVGFMNQDKDYQRYFAYLNLFVAAMLILVLSDNLLLLFLGWEGVGLCSYLLIGFWHEKTDNNLAANKAFIMTRIGDTGMAIGLFLLFFQLGTLDIQQIQTNAMALWPLNQNNTVFNFDMVTICCLLLLSGAVGKSGQFPLQSWLPDAMAGPTPVSALIHAATMVTAGVYLIARLHGLFELSPLAMQCIAAVGAITLFIAASAALVQNDVKRILAYSTISQIGYMFLALGAGAFSAAIFHLMTHAFFKALLFLSAGALIYCMHHEHNIFRMGGLAKKLPLVCVCFFIGCAALASLPLMSGFFSKELILESLLDKHMYGYWLVAIAGAFITAFYSFRLFFVIFYGKNNKKPDTQPNKLMIIPLSVLALLALFGGIQPQGLINLFTATESTNETHSIGIVIFTIVVPLCAVVLCWFQFKNQVFGGDIRSGVVKKIHKFLYSGWAFDWFYQQIFIRPFIEGTHFNRNDVIDLFYKALISISRWLHRFFIQFQNGQLRWYGGSLVLFCTVALTYLMTNG